jgi:hypothetical protein
VTLVNIPRISVGIIENPLQYNKSVTVRLISPLIHDGRRLQDRWRGMGFAAQQAQRTAPPSGRERRGGSLKNPGQKVRRTTA